ncbi:MAG: hypothetical protein HC941_04000 [Microcoleus sp. SU_5_3]|nr:hypothetical protein [Microcoleus sp. SU_5_3]
MATNGITPPTNERPNYFAGQYLLEDDFQLEQQYHIDRQRWHHHLLHVSGIAEGLKVTKGEGALVVNVSEGSAIDPQGRQITLLAAQKVDLTKAIDSSNAAKLDGPYTLYIGYSEQKTGQQTAGNEITSRRWQEVPKFQLSSSELKDFIPLAKLTISSNAVTGDIDNSDRVYSGLRLPTIDGEISLSSKNDGSKSVAELNGSLNITGTLSVTGNVGIGTTSPEIELHINGPSATTDVNNPSKLWPIETQELLRLVRPPSSITVSGQNKSANAVGLFVGTFEEKSLGGTRFDIALSDYTSIGYGRTPNIKVMTLQSNGNVGIGTTSPGTSKLKIANSESDFADISFSGSGMGQLQIIGWSSGWNINAKTANKHLYLNRDSDATSNVYIGRSGKELFVRGTDGNVGIGTTDPAGTLDVQGNVYVGTGQNEKNHKLAIRGPNQPGGSRSFQDISYEFTNAGSAKIRAYRGTSWETYLQFLTNPSISGKDEPQVSLHINHDGNVGIGTASPQNKLDVAGIIRSSQEGFQFPDGSRQITAVRILTGTMSYEYPSGFNAVYMEADFSGFSVTPTIFLSLIRIDNNKDRNLRIQASVKTVTNAKLVVNVKGWADTILYAVTVNWLAFGY